MGDHDALLLLGKLYDFLAGLVVLVEIALVIALLVALAARWTKSLLVAGVVFAVAGGVLWNVLSAVGVCKSFMGPDPEPHGFCALIWAATFLPLLLPSIFLNRSLEMTAPAQRVVPQLGAIVGAAIGAWVFYDGPFGEERGIRAYIDTKGWSFEQQEFWLAFLWSGVVALFAFTLMALVGRLVRRERVGFVALVSTLFVQVALSVLTTTTVVTAFVVFFPDHAGYGPLRGFAAGLTLRTMFFVGLVIGDANGHKIVRALVDDVLHAPHNWLAALHRRVV